MGEGLGSQQERGTYYNLDRRMEKDRQKTEVKKSGTYKSPLGPACKPSDIMKYKYAW
jgi:hypothetical protein